eukprot:gene11260-13141_t
MNFSLLKRLHQQGLISVSSFEKIEQKHQNSLFSLHWELKTLLYLGVMLLSTGLGIVIYQNIDTIGHQVILLIIALISGGCFFYCFKNRKPFSRALVKSPGSMFDYLLLLGSLSFLTFVGYIQYQYQIFGTNYGLATFFPMVVLFFLAYEFDHLGILSLGITNLALWMGVSVTPKQLLMSINYNSQQIVYVYLLLGLLLLAAAFLSSRYDFKKHFGFTYMHFGAHVAFISMLCAYFIYYDSGYAFLFLLGVFGLGYYVYQDALKRSSFYFLLLAVLYAYFAFSCLVVNVVIRLGNNEGPIFLAFFYFIHLQILQETQQASQTGLLSAEEQQNIKQKYMALLYSPGVFTRIGLFILTCIISSAGSGMLALFLMEAHLLDSPAWVFFTAAAFYVALELMTRQSKHYKSGVDDALILIVTGTFLTALYWSVFENMHLGDVSGILLISALMFALCLYLTFRFSDMLMAAGSLIALLVFIFFMVYHAGRIGAMILPFVMILCTALIYFLLLRLELKLKAWYYENALIVAQIVVLIALYLSGNYFVVRSLNDALHHSAGAEPVVLPFGWFFWLWTICIPLLYIAYGLKRKNVVLLRTGLILVAAAAFTIRNYFHLMSMEALLCVAGAVLIAVAYAAIRYFNVPKHGITYEQTDEQHLMDHMRVEALIVAETFSQTPGPVADSTKFGGGDFGGGGASGNF